MSKEPRLFTYVIKHDAGSAPNPFGGVCTLAICKPKVRAYAQVGDWIAATGSKSFPLEDAEHRLVYAMQVTAVMSIRKYDEYCRREMEIKIPKRPSKTFEEYVGDAIYRFGDDGSVTQLESVHGPWDQQRDLGGVNVLLSKRFVYFGDAAPLLPTRLHPIIKSGQGHQVNPNQGFVGEFVKWITSLGLNGIRGNPITKVIDWKDSKTTGSCSKAHQEEDDDDESCS